MKTSIAALVTLAAFVAASGNFTSSTEKACTGGKIIHFWIPKNDTNPCQPLDNIGSLRVTDLDPGCRFRVFGDRNCDVVEKQAKFEECTQFVNNTNSFIYDCQ
ncbi:hypothetical protein BU24DRAFT_406419 [Aaosphaeria arxii CBS 175.79]|uniref:Uncharacterized protein n=1 Tax=Aaosphaeria arxii CBS 175.79 TaxID=1450172 RepID=A0A6A5Y4T0_9PLEO|nr:uncharacterized protein BU24DRAFT_406419 [Aaosphaeria arxii CBS 175.79]KAF2019800.1 hypothetical protein BU24DRAFT_406419 [Aaosphaeria arxii CBS 175.79]